jgi:hypothetical protein
MTASVRVYVSGPMSLGDRAVNVQRGIDAGNWLSDRGVAALVPHYSSHPQARPAEPGTEQYERLIRADLAWVEAADAVLLLPGRSGGAERECAHARAHGVPVFTDREECLVYALGLKALRDFTARWGHGQHRPAHPPHGASQVDVIGPPQADRGSGGPRPHALPAQGPITAGARKRPRTCVAHTPHRYVKRIDRVRAAGSRARGSV